MSVRVPAPPNPYCAGVSLLVEGGGMRGFYSAGVLACLADAGMRFPLVAGVSSGALAAAAYVGGKLGGANDLDFDALGRSPAALLSPAGLVRPRAGLLRTDAFIDLFLTGCWEGVATSNQLLCIPATDAITGELTWWDTHDFSSGPAALRERAVASASIPFVMPQASVDGRVYADGGIRDSIPVQHAESKGYRRHVLLLTRPRGYVKGRQHLELYLRWWLRPYPALKRAMLQRHVHYNESIRRVEAIEDEGRAFVFRMNVQDLGRFEYDPRKFRTTYERGYADAEARLPELERWLEEK